MSAILGLVGEGDLVERSRRRTASSMASSSKGLSECFRPVRSMALFLMRGLSWSSARPGQRLVRFGGGDPIGRMGSGYAVLWWEEEGGLEPEVGGIRTA